MKFNLTLLLLLLIASQSVLTVTGQDAKKNRKQDRTQKVKRQQKKTDRQEEQKRNQKRNVKKKTTKQKSTKQDAAKKKQAKSADSAKKKNAKTDAKPLTLKKLFPEKSPFGPSASRTAFSKDGRYAAFLYRPFKERRHGSDLHIYDFEKEVMTRLTSVSVMAKFQASTRKVEKDRIEKFKKAQAKKKSAEQDKKEKTKSTSSKTDQKKLGDQVSEKDAEDEKAPRYSGISSFRWHPTGHEILFTSGGEIYHIKIGDSEPKRLTRTQDSERSVQFLPDGSGYLYMRDGNLFRVRKGQTLIEQIDPSLGSGESMSSYRISPDGTKLVIQTRKGNSPFSSDRKVKIVNYRGRFAEVREYNRVVSDDPVVEQEVFIYFYDLSKHENEEAKLKLVYKTKLNSPRDAVSTPAWSLDSKQVTFADFHFEDENVGIYTAAFPVDKKSEAKGSADAKSGPSKSRKSNQGKSKDEQKDQKKSGDAKMTDDQSQADKKKPEEKPLAKLQYRFLHFGGPNTPRMIEPRFLKDSSKIVFVSEQSGFRHLHKLDTTYQTVVPITQGNYEVYLQDVSKDRKYALVTSTKTSAARTMAYRIDLETNEMVALTEMAGNYSSVAISQDGTRMVGNYSTFGKLTELVRVNQKARKEQFKVLTDSHSPAAKEITKPIPEFFTYKNREGQILHGTLFKPAGWKKTDKRPCMIYVYGGPLGTRHSVVDGSYRSDSYFFAYYMAEVHGFVTVTIDPRGQSGYGALFEKSNFKQVGKPQVNDLVDGVKHLVENYGVDSKRVGLHGWSFGGFQTQMCLYTEPDVFAAGIAGAGPTEWENYNKWYSTGTIDRSAAGKLDQQKYSLLPLAKNLKAKLLLVHGMEDSNVLYQDTVRVYRELIKAGKETLVELFLDPTGGHGLGGDVKRLGKYRKYEEFFVRTLGSEKSPSKK